MEYKNKIEKGIDLVRDQEFVRRIWSKDSTVWKSGQEQAQMIRNSLGWLTVAEWVLPRWKDLQDFSDEVKNRKFKSIVLMGMGGSSLAPELLRQSLPQKKGYPHLLVLDSTDPETISEIEKSIDIPKTLFIFASKSGGTIEPSSFYRYFYEKSGQKGEQFIAITDPGTELERLATEKGFLRIFLNPPDIGGRFSALSYFGMVPAALSGMDGKALLESAEKMMQSCRIGSPLESNPGVELGVFMGELAKSGRDKLTLILGEGLEPFGLWIEQLVAESSGKEGKGIVPITGESLGSPGSYGMDRCFVSVSVGDKINKSLESKLKEIESSHPVLKIHLKECTDLGGEFFRWEFAISVACALLEVNPFDQPDVQSAKNRTKSLLEQFQQSGNLPRLHQQFEGKKFKLSFSESALAKISVSHSDPVEIFRQFWKQLKPNDYIGLLTYLPLTPELETKWNQFRTFLRDKTGSATLFGLGPRYLHSTGQLHKGGPNNGIYLLFKRDPSVDFPVAGEKYSFGNLENAQAIGDFQALDSKKRRVACFHLQEPIEESIDEVLDCAHSSVG